MATDNIESTDLVEKLRELSEYLPADTREVSRIQGERAAEEYAAPEIARYLRDKGVAVNSADSEEVGRKLYSFLNMDNEDNWLNTVISAAGGVLGNILGGSQNEDGSNAQLEALRAQNQKLQAEAKRAQNNTMYAVAGAVILIIIVVVVKK